MLPAPTSPHKPSRSPILAPRAPAAKILDLRPSSGLASGLKRVGGRGGFTRLGKATRLNISNTIKGKGVISHRF